MHWEPDTSLIDAAREIAPIIQKHNEEAERERRLSRPVLNCIARDGSPANVHSPFARGIGDRPRHPRTRRRGNRSSRLCGRLDPGEPFGLGLLLCASPRRGSRGDLQPWRGHPDRRPIRPPTTRDVDRTADTASPVERRSSATAMTPTGSHRRSLWMTTNMPRASRRCAMVYFPSEECEIIDTWDVMGMRGTGSHDISVTDVYVPKSRTFPMVPEFEPGSHYRGPLYRLPVVGAAATGIPTPMLGVARRALDEVTELALTKTPVASSGLLKERSSAQVQLGKAEAILRSGRLLLLDTLSEAWQRCLDGRDPLAGAESGPLACEGPRDEQRGTGSGACVQHCGNDGVSSHQPVGTLLPGRPDDETSCLRLRGIGMGPSGKCILGFHRTFRWLPSSAGRRRRVQAMPR